jgi:hypothetical protein
MKILVNLHAGYAALFDSQGERACEWYDRQYADAIRRGECTTRRWADMIVELSITRGYVVKRETGWIATQHYSKWNNDLPASWQKCLKSA